MAKNDTGRRAVSKYDAWAMHPPKDDTRPTCSTKYDTKYVIQYKYDTMRSHSQKDDTQSSSLQKNSSNSIQCALNLHERHTHALRTTHRCVDDVPPAVNNRNPSFRQLFEWRVGYVPANIGPIGIIRASYRGASTIDRVAQSVDKMRRSSGRVVVSERCLPWPPKTH